MDAREGRTEKQQNREERRWPIKSNEYHNEEKNIEKSSSTTIKTIETIITEP